MSLGGVDGLDVVRVSLSEFVIVVDDMAGEDVCILGGRSSSTSTTPALLNESLVFFSRLAKVAVDGGRTTDFCGDVLVFFRENHPDFSRLSSSRTTIRSSVKSGSYKVDKHAE